MIVRVMFNGQSEDIASIEEFGSALDRFDRSDTFELWLSAADGASMVMLRSECHAWLMYLRHDGDAGFHSMGQPSRSGTAAYTLGNGQVDDYPLAWCIDVEQCLKALAYFFVNEGSRPEWVAWHES